MKGEPLRAGDTGGKKVVIVGLDGVPFSLLRYYVEQGIMPHFKEMIASGDFLPMNSTLPEVSSVAWSSFMTGKNPAEHGIFGFMEIDTESYEYIFPNYFSLRVPTFWEQWSKPTVAYNIPQTYPARPMNGVLISGFVALDLDKAVYPQRIHDYLTASDYKLDVKTHLAPKDPEAFFKNLFEVFEKRIEVFDYLYNNEAWQIFIGTITETDRLHHFFFDSAQEGKFFDIFVDFYQRLDKFLWKTFLKAQDDGALFLTCSDHGFAPLKSEVYVNQYLQENGLLITGGNGGLKDISSHAKAFCLDPGRIYVHLQDKYSRGSVTPFEYEDIRETIKTLFETLMFNGSKVVRKVYYKEEIFSGPLSDEAPDLYVLGEPGFDIKGALNKDAVFGLTHFKGTHTYHDAHLFIAGGERPALQDNLSINMIASMIESYLL
jgi:predicted AlkP superfamily phosphohydrolase/phosphomutase